MLRKWLATLMRRSMFLHKTVFKFLRKNKIEVLFRVFYFISRDRYAYPSTLRTFEIGKIFPRVRHIMFNFETFSSGLRNNQKFLAKNFPIVFGELALVVAWCQLSK